MDIALERARNKSGEWIKVGDRVRTKDGTVGEVETIEKVYAGTAHEFLTVLIKLEEPATCGCGRCSFEKMGTLVDDLELAPLH